MSTNHTEQKNYGKQFFSGVAVLAISTFIVKIIGLFYKIPMMKYLTEEGMGYFNSAYDIYSLLFVIATTGVPVAISILVSENIAKENIVNVKRIFRVSLIVLGVIGLIGTAFLAVFHNSLAKLIRNDLASFSILAISPTLLLICISSAIRGYFQGHQIMLPTAISQVIEAIGKLLLGLGFSIIAINKGYSFPMVAAFAVLGLSIGVAISTLYLILHKLIYNSKKQETVNLHTVESNSIIFSKLFKIALPITLSSAILSLTKIIDMTMILGRLHDIGYTQAQGNAIYGAYSTMAVSIYNLPATLISAISLPLVPILVSAIEKREQDREKSIISSSLKLTALVGFPAGLGISVFSKQILSLLFSEQADSIEYVAPLLSILGMSVFLSSMITTTNAILQSYKLVNKSIISMISGMGVKLVAAYILIGNENVNIYGAPISTLFSVILIVSMNLYFIIKRCGKISSVFKLFVKPFISSLISIIVGVGIYLLTFQVVPSSISIILSIVAVVIVYIFVIMKLNVIDKDELLMLPKGDKLLALSTKIKSK